MGRQIEIRKFGNPAKGTKNGILQGNIALVSNVVAQTKLLAPVDDGQLRNSYMWKANGQEGGYNDSPKDPADMKLSYDLRNEKEACAGTAQPHAIWQEFGTRKMKPQPHFRPAIDLVVKGTPTKVVLAKIIAEEMKGPLKEGVKRVQF